VLIGVDKSCGDISCWTSNGNFFSMTTTEYGTADDNVLVIHIEGTGMPSGGYYFFISTDMVVTVTRQSDGASMGSFDISELFAEYSDMIINEPPPTLPPLEAIPFDANGNLIKSRFKVTHKFFPSLGTRSPRHEVLYNGARTVVNLQALLLKGGARTTPIR
jgi:hypothetical protein